MSASLRSFLSRSGLSPRQDRFPSAPFGALGFAIHSQARQDIQPNRVPFVRTDRLASGCSPPHLRGPQLLSPFSDAVTFGFQPVERLVEWDLTSYSDALSGARVRASSPAASGRHALTYGWGSIIGLPIGGNRAAHCATIRTWQPTWRSIRISSIGPSRLVSGERTKTASVKRALEEFVARRQQGKIVSLFGNLEWDPKYDYKATRSRD
jgi:hypothetical protein